MEIISLIDSIYEKLKVDPYLILSENDLTCQMYKHLIQDQTKRVFTEWSMKTEKIEEFPERRIGRNQYDLVICDKNNVVYDKKNGIYISYYRKIIEIKVHWQTSGNHMFNKDKVGRDYEKLRKLDKNIVEKKYLIAFNLYKTDVSKDLLAEWNEKLMQANIIFIYKYLNTRNLFHLEKTIY